MIFSHVSAAIPLLLASPREHILRQEARASPPAPCLIKGPPLGTSAPPLFDRGATPRSMPLPCKRSTSLDTLDILNKAEELGGASRKQAMLQTFRAARELGCDVTPGGGKVGGFNVRYGSLKYAILDMNTRGEVFLHIKPHPSKELEKEKHDDANKFVDSLPGVTIKKRPDQPLRPDRRDHRGYPRGHAQLFPRARRQHDPRRVLQASLGLGIKFGEELRRG